jgi:heme o synthase
MSTSNQAAAEQVFVPRNTVLRDLAELTKSRVTTLIVMTAWCGYYFSARAAGVRAISWHWLVSMLGIGLVSSGTAALNEVMEHKIDARMRRTVDRPIPSGRMSLAVATIIGVALTVGGSIMLSAFTNPLTGLLTFLTSVVYLGAYTPLKQLTPWCTFVGAIPGAMPGVLGWTAASGHLHWGASILFAILFVWQFPHFFSIAWLYRDDYAAGGIRMLPVVHPDGRSTARRIMAYGVALVPISAMPAFFGMAGNVYLAGSILLGLGLLYYCTRLAILDLPVSAAISKLHARQLLRATVIYLPILFVLMIVNSKHI